MLNTAHLEPIRVYFNKLRQNHFTFAESLYLTCYYFNDNFTIEQIKEIVKLS